MVDRRERSGEEVFAEIYERHFSFVWRSVRRLGVAEASVDDAVQDVFLVVHRRLDDFEGRSSIKTWLFGIVLRVVKDWRRTDSRKRRVGAGAGDGDLDSVAADGTQSPHALTEQAQAVRMLHRVLDSLDDDKRAVFVMAELEQMSAPEIAEALGVNLNTVYSRLRAARRAFNRGVDLERARAEASR
jgi:RNA polymerase sigma-70 factor (ECF subfamily)